MLLLSALLLAAGEPSPDAGEWVACRPGSTQHSAMPPADCAGTPSFLVGTGSAADAFDVVGFAEKDDRGRSRQAYLYADGQISFHVVDPAVKGGVMRAELFPYRIALLGQSEPTRAL